MHSRWSGCVSLRQALAPDSSCHPKRQLLGSPPVVPAVVVAVVVVPPPLLLLLLFPAVLVPDPPPLVVVVPSSVVVALPAPVSPAVPPSPPLPPNEPVVDDVDDSVSAVVLLVVVVLLAPPELVDELVFELELELEAELAEELVELDDVEDGPATVAEELELLVVVVPLVPSLPSVFRLVPEPEVSSSGPYCSSSVATAQFTRIAPNPKLHTRIVAFCTRVLPRARAGWDTPGECIPHATLARCLSHIWRDGRRWTTYRP